MTTTTFSVTYEVPVSPERLAQLEEKVTRAAKAIADVSSIVAIVGDGSSFDRQAAELRVTGLREQMLPEKRTESARQVTKDDSVEWWCPRSECEHCIALFKYGALDSDAECKCGAIVNREDHPMPLDLYRMRTRRNDGVEIKANHG